MQNGRYLLPLWSIETLAIEKAMKSNGQLNDDWIKQQSDFKEDFIDINDND